MFSVSRPIDVVVLNCCVTETKLTPCWSNISIILREVHQRSAEAVDLVDHDAVDHPPLDVGQQSLEGRPVHVGTGIAAVIVRIRNYLPTANGGLP